MGVQGLKPAADGVLVISEFAGASVELSYAIRTNPYDIKDLVQGLEQALALDQKERKLRMERLFEQVTHYDIDNWGKAFMHELENIRREDSVMQLS